MPGAQHPQARLPFRAAFAIPALQRQHRANGIAETALEYLAQPFALLGIIQLVGQRIEVDGKLALLEKIGKRVLVGRNHRTGIYPQPLRQCPGKLQRFVAAVAVVLIRRRYPLRIAPERKAVAAPETGKRPARQRLAWVPFALSEVY